MPRRLPARSLVAAMAAALLAIGGCAGHSALRSNFVEFAPDQKQQITERTTRPYRIQQADELTIVFSYLKELNQEKVLVLPDGSVTLIGLDRVVLEGRTVAEADSLLTAAYGRNYRDPDLSVGIKTYKAREVYVLGEVTRPGLYPVPERSTGVMGAIATAGGFTEDAAVEGTILARVTAEGYLVQELDLSRFEAAEGAAFATLTLEPYDVLYVPRSRIGDFAYFSRTILAGLVNIAQIAAQGRFVTGGGYLR